MNRQASVIVADDFRLEASGKMIIIGAYAGDIGLFTEQHLINQLCFLFIIEGKIEDGLPGPGFIEITMPNGRVTTQAIPDLDLWPKGGDRKNWIMRQLVGVQQVVLTYGQIKARIVYEDHEIVPVCPWVVPLSPNPSPTASPQPS